MSCRASRPPRAARVVARRGRDRARVGADAERDREPDDHDAAGCEPGDDERVGVELLAREQRPEDERAEQRPEDGAEEDEGHPARAPLGRVHLGRRRAREQHVPLAAPASAKPATTSGARRARSRAPVSAAPAMPQPKPARITGIRPKRSIARPAGSAASAPEREEDRRAEPEDPLDPGHEHERHRRHRDDELEHPREADEPGGEQERVPANRVGVTSAGGGAASRSATSATIPAIAKP